MLEPIRMGTSMVLHDVALRHFESRREVCHVGQKSDLFREIWLPEHLMY